jgi:hypothetical protein
VIANPSVADQRAGTTLRDRMELARRRSRTTPGHLQMLVMVIAGLAGAVFLLGAGTLLLAQRQVDGIHDGTVPAIVGAQQIHATLADADRAEANAFLSGATEATAPHQQYTNDIAMAMRQLEMAAEQAGGDVAVGRQIQKVSVQVTQYTTLVDIARADNEQGYPVGAAYLRRASEMMHMPGSGILANVDRLGDMDARDLNTQNVTLLVSIGLLVVYAGAAGALLTALRHSQQFLRHRFRRRHNGRLIMATGLVLSLLFALAAQGIVTGQALVTSEGQDYGRLLNLWHIRSLVYDANGNESLSLIARGNGDAFDQAFEANVGLLVDRPLTDDLVDQAAVGNVNFGGLLADELNNSSGTERDSAIGALRAFREFMGVDATVRARSQQGAHDDASHLALGSQPGQLGAAFTKLDSALGRTIALVQSNFDTTIMRAEISLIVHIALQLVVLLAAFVAYQGLKPRMDEYRV